MWIHRREILSNAASGHGVAAAFFLACATLAGGCQPIDATSPLLDDSAVEGELVNGTVVRSATLTVRALSVPALAGLGGDRASASLETRVREVTSAQIDLEADAIGEQISDKFEVVVPNGGYSVPLLRASYATECSDGFAVCARAPRRNVKLPINTGDPVYNKLLIDPTAKTITFYEGTTMETRSFADAGIELPPGQDPFFMFYVVPFAANASVGEVVNATLQIRRMR